MAETTRTLGFRHAFAIGLGTMIAAGIFSLSGTAVSQIGSSSVISFVIAAIIAGITASAYSEFASIYSESGGGYLFCSRTVDNDYIIYIEGVMLFLGYSATTAFYLATMGEWVHQFIFSSIPPWASGVAVALILGWLNSRGTEESGTFQIIVTGLKVIVLLIFIAGAFTYRPVDTTINTFVTSFSSDIPNIIRIAGLAFITFFGFSAIAASAGEIKKPRKTVPLAIAASIVTVTILYTLVIVAMVNAPPELAQQIATQGETAMGEVAAEFLGPIGRTIIVAGAIFSMVSASNASILAASRIGYLMGQEGRAFRSFHNIHKDYGTPFWAVLACTLTICSLILIFIGVFPAHSHGNSIKLGLSALTGFANLNLLIPLSVVNIALLLSRRKEEMERPFKVPLASILLSVGIVANLGLVANLPIKGVLSGIIAVSGLFIIYLIWGGAESVDSLMTDVGEEIMSNTDRESTAMAEGDVYNTIIPIFEEEDIKSVPRTIEMSREIGNRQDVEETDIKILNVQKIPEQTPSDMVDKTELNKRKNKIQEKIKHVSMDGVKVSIDNFTSQDPIFTLMEVSREEDTDLILVDYPEYDTKVVRKLQNKAPSDVLYTYNINPQKDLETINLGVGGGPNHNPMVEIVNTFGKTGSKVNVIRVDPSISGTPEKVEETLDKLSSTEKIQVHNIEEKSVARGLIDVSKSEGGLLFIGASRDHALKQTLFGSTPDKVLDIAEEAGVPVAIYRSRASATSRIEDVIFTIYRAVRTITR